MTCLGRQSHTERQDLRVLLKTPVERSWLDVRLHIEILYCAILDVFFSEICSLMHVLAIAIANFNTIHCSEVGVAIGSFDFLCVFGERAMEQKMIYLFAC